MIASIIGVSLMAMSLYVLLASPYFTLSPSRVIVERNDTISDTPLAYQALRLWYGRSVFFVDYTKIQSRIQELQKNLSSVQISRLFPSGLKVVLTSYPPVFQTKSLDGSQFFVITSNGVFIEVSQEDLRLPQLRIVSAQMQDFSIIQYKEGISPKHIQSIQNLLKTLVNTFKSPRIVGTTVFFPEQELHVSLENGTLLIGDMATSASIQLDTIKEYLQKNTLEDPSAPITYIDMRIPGRLFVCRDTLICKKNLIRIYGNAYQ
jgi:hypothetical protein